MNVYLYKADIYCADCGKSIKQELEGAATGRNEATGRFESVDNYDGADSDSYPCGPYPNGGGEADTPQHCASRGNCPNAEICDGLRVGCFLQNPLTSDGVEYVRERISNYHNFGYGNKDVLKLWSEYYCIPFNGEKA